MTECASVAQPQLFTRRVGTVQAIQFDGTNFEAIEALADELGVIRDDVSLRIWVYEDCNLQTCVPSDWVVSEPGGCHVYDDARFHATYQSVRVESL